MGTPWSGPTMCAGLPQPRSSARRTLEGLFGGDRLKRVELAVDALDAIEIRLRRRPARADRRPRARGERDDRQIGHVGHPKTRGTLKRPASVAASGALASASDAPQRLVRRRRLAPPAG